MTGLRSALICAAKSTIDTAGSISSASVQAPTYRRKFALGLTAPYGLIAAFVSHDDYRVDVRDSNRLDLRMELGRRFSESLDVAAGLTYDRRNGKTNVPIVPGISGAIFDLRGYGAFVRAEYALDERWLVGGRLGVRRGDVESTSQRSRAVFLASDAIADDPAFEDPLLFGYRLRGTTTSLGFTLSYAPARRHGDQRRVHRRADACRTGPSLSQPDRQGHIRLSFLNAQGVVRMRLSPRTLFALGAVLAGTVHAQSAEIVAKVTDAQGRPLADAVVVAWPADGNIRLTDEASRRGDLPGRQGVRSEGDAGTRRNRRRVPEQRYRPPSCVLVLARRRSSSCRCIRASPASPVVFDKPGVVVLGCNIHDWMVAYVYVSESPHFAKTGADGRPPFPILRRVPTSYEPGTRSSRVRRSRRASRSTCRKRGGATSRGH